MKGLLIRWLFLTVAILVAAHLIQGFEVKGFWSAFLAAAILGVLNALFRPVLIILTLPDQHTDPGSFHLCHQRRPDNDGLGSGRGL